MAYVPFGVRTEYSFLDGMCRIEPLVERARALRFGAVGIADLHSTFGFGPFAVAARAAGVRPILGVTVRLQADVEGQSSWGADQVFLKLPVGEVMERNVVCIDPDKTVEEGMAIRNAKRVRHLPVIAHGKLLGIVSIGDLVKHRIAAVDAEAAAMQAYITAHYAIGRFGRVRRPGWRLKPVRGIARLGMLRL